MQKSIQLQSDPATAASDTALKELIQTELSLNKSDQFSYKIIKRSIDARGRKIKINLSISVFINEVPKTESVQMEYKDVGKAKKTCHIIGAGPAGLFAALRMLELGIKPIIFERGKDVKARRRDLAKLNKEQIVNPESNYCFGEGGAGTYSDGKLYTRSGKRGSTEKILKTFVYHGASDEIMVDAHPHIGTNKLPQLIERIRETILKYGGEIFFETKLIDFTIASGKISHVQTQNPKLEKNISIQALLLATGHSARDIYELLHTKKVLIEMKPFAMGVRVEHPQSLIDGIQYHCSSEEQIKELRTNLPAASYSLVEQVNGRGVYSF